MLLLLLPLTTRGQGEMMTMLKRVGSSSAIRHGYETALLHRQIVMWTQRGSVIVYGVWCGSQ